MTEISKQRTFQSETWYFYMIVKSKANPANWKQHGWDHTLLKIRTQMDQSD